MKDLSPLDRFGGRKFILSVLGILALALLAGLRIPVPWEIVAGIAALAGSYQISNAAVTRKALAKSSPAVQVEHADEVEVNS